MKRITLLMLITLVSSFSLNAQFNLTLETYALNNFQNFFNPSIYFGAVDIQPKASTIIASDEDGQERIASFYSVTNDGVWLTIAGENGNVIASKIIKASSLGTTAIPGVGTQQLTVTAAASHPEEKDLIVFTGSLKNPSNSSRTVMFIATIDLTSFAIQSTVINFPSYPGTNRAEGVQVKHLANLDYIVVGKSIAGSTKTTSITKYNAANNTSSTKLIKNTNLIPNDFEFSNINPQSIVIAGYTLRNHQDMFEVCGHILGSGSNSSAHIHITFLEYDYVGNFIHTIKSYKTDKLYSNLSGGVPGVASTIYKNSLKIIKNDEYFIAISKNVNHSSGKFESMLLQLDNQYDLVDSRSFNNSSNIKIDHNGRLAKMSEDVFATSMNYVGQGITNFTERGTIITTASFSDPFSAIDVLFRFDVNPLNSWSSNPSFHYGGYNDNSLIANADHIYSSQGTISNNFANWNQNTAYILSYDPSFKTDRDVCEFETTVSYSSNCIEIDDLDYSAQISSSNPSSITMISGSLSYDPHYCNPENAEYNNSQKSLNFGQNANNEGSLDSNVGMELFPNPNNGLFTLALSIDKSKTAKLSVKNMLGQVVYSELINGDNSIEKQMDLEKFGKGIYMISLETDSQNITKKVIVK